MDYRIRATTLNRASLNALTKEYRAINDWKVSIHCEVKLKDRQFTHEELFDVVDNGELIEFHPIDINRRVMLHKDGVCVVMDLTDQTIVTIFKKGERGQEDNILFGGS